MKFLNSNRTTDMKNLLLSVACLYSWYCAAKGRDRWVA